MWLAIHVCTTWVGWPVLLCMIARTYCFTECTIACTRPLDDPMLHTCMIVCATILNFMISYLLACTWMTELHHCDPVHVWLPVHATWLYFTHSLGYFLTTLDRHIQISELGLKRTLQLRTRLTLRSKRTSSRSFQTCLSSFYGSWASPRLFTICNNNFASFGNVILL